MGRKKKSTDDWFIEHGTKLRDTMKSISHIRPDIVNEYRPHTALKLMCVGWWSDIFSKIIDSRNIPKIYIDICSGSGLTRVKDDVKLLPGSTIVAETYANSPYSYIICIESDDDRASALEERLKETRKPSTFSVINGRAEDEIATLIKILRRKKGIIFAFYDPEGFEGFSWEVVDNICEFKGDLLITWDFHGISRVFGGGHIDVLKRIYGEDVSAIGDTSTSLTDKFITRLKTKRDIVKEIDIRDEARIVYKELLCVRKTPGGSPWLNAFDDLKKRLEVKDATLIRKWLDIVYGEQARIIDFG